MVMITVHQKYASVHDQGEIYTYYILEGRANILIRSPSRHSQNMARRNYCGKAPKVLTESLLGQSGLSSVSYKYRYHSDWPASSVVGRERQDFEMSNHL